MHDYMLNKIGMSPLVSGFFWDDFWPVILGMHGNGIHQRVQ